jgi:uncharacterized protein
MFSCRWSVRGDSLLSSSDDPQFEQHAPLSTEALPPVPLASTPEPAENPVWNGWDVLLIAALALVSLVVLQLVVLLAAKQWVYPHLSLRNIAQKAVLAIVAQFFSYIVLAICMVVLVQEKYHVLFWPAIRWNWPRGQLKFIGLGALVLLGLNLLGRFLPMPQSTPFDELFKHPRDAYLMSVFAVTFGPLMEELFFRGFLYPVLARRLGVFQGIILTALPFGLIHMFQYGYAWGVVLLIFLMGVVCTAVRAVTRSVASSFLVHVGYNATEMLIFAIATDGFRHMEKATLIGF